VELNKNGNVTYIKNGDYVFQTSIETKSQKTVVHCLNPIRRRITNYTELQLLGKFTDKEITLLRLKLGPIISWNEEHKQTYPYSANRSYSYTSKLSEVDNLITIGKLQEYCKEDAVVTMNLLKKRGPYVTE